MIFQAPNGLRYDTAIHDYIDEDGNMASAKDVAAAWGTSAEEVEDERKERAERVVRCRKGDNQA